MTITYNELEDLARFAVKYVMPPEAILSRRKEWLVDMLLTKGMSDAEAKKAVDRLSDRFDLLTGKSFTSTGAGTTQVRGPEEDGGSSVGEVQ